MELVVGVLVLLTFAAKLLPADAWGTFPYERHGGIFVHTLLFRCSKFVIATASVFAPCFFMGATFPLLCHV